MKRAIKLTLAVALMMSATSLFAQKFGRINTQEIIMNMSETKEMQTNLESFAKELQDQVESINVEFNNKRQEFQKNYNTYSESVRQLKEKELYELQQRLEDYSQVAQQDYQKRQNELLAPIVEKARAAIDKVAKANGFMAVFDISTGAIAYFDEATLTDLAPQVRAELGITETPAAETTSKSRTNARSVSSSSQASSQHAFVRWQPPEV